jgi:hypothetical protein
MHVATPQKADRAGIGLDAPTTGASVGPKLRQRPKAWLTSKQIHRAATSLAFANHRLHPGGRLPPLV